MHTTTQILDAIAEKHGGATDYRLSKLLGTSPSAVNNWRKGRTALSADYALKAAALLDWEPAYVLACMEHERAEKLEATDEIKATWEKIAQRFKPMAAAILAVILLAGLLPSQEVRAAGVTHVTSAVYTLCAVAALCRLAWCVAQIRRVIVRPARLAAVIS